eukprot:UN27792
MLKKIANGELVPLPKEWDNELKSLVQKMWKEEPADRPDAKMLLDRFRELYTKSKESLKFDFLLSHHKKDNFFVKKLQAYLECQGYEVWKPDSRTVSERFDLYFKSKRLLCILSKDYVKDDRCISEYRESGRLGKRIEVVCPQTKEKVDKLKNNSDGDVYFDFKFHQKLITIHGQIVNGVQRMFDDIIEDFKRSRVYFCISYNRSNITEEELKFANELHEELENEGFFVWKQDWDQDCTQEEWKAVAKD